MNYQLSPLLSVIFLLPLFDLKRFKTKTTNYADNKEKKLRLTWVADKQIIT